MHTRHQAKRKRPNPQKFGKGKSRKTKGHPTESAAAAAGKNNGGGEQPWWMASESEDNYSRLLESDYEEQPSRRPCWANKEQDSRSKLPKWIIRPAGSCFEFKSEYVILNVSTLKKGMK